MKAVDFFCGIGGMTAGLKNAGIKVLYGIDNDIECKDTYEGNNKAKYLQRDIKDFKIEELEKNYKIKRNDDSLIFIACSPCQYWTKINTDKAKSTHTAFLLEIFKNFVDYYNPGFIIIENVPGLNTNSKQSKLIEFLDFIGQKKYSFDGRAIKLTRYGVPQNRTRYILLASRIIPNIKLPDKINSSKIRVKDYLGPKNGFPIIKAGHKDSSNFIHTASNLSKKNLERIKMLKMPGADRNSLTPSQLKNFEAKCHANGSFKDVYARMWWDRPAPTITTRFNSFSNGRFGHPSEDRALSLREGATLQTFSKLYKFKASSQSTVARQIGNAVPPVVAEILGNHIKSYLRSYKNGIK